MRRRKRALLIIFTAFCGAVFYGYHREKEAASDEVNNPERLILGRKIGIDRFEDTHFLQDNLNHAQDLGHINEVVQAHPQLGVINIAKPKSSIDIKQERFNNRIVDNKVQLSDSDNHIIQPQIHHRNLFPKPISLIPQAPAKTDSQRGGEHLRNKADIVSFHNGQRRGDISLPNEAKVLSNNHGHVTIKDVNPAPPVVLPHNEDQRRLWRMQQELQDLNQQNQQLQEQKRQQQQQWNKQQAEQEQKMELMRQQYLNHLRQQQQINPKPGQFQQPPVQFQQQPGQFQPLQQPPQQPGQFQPHQQPGQFQPPQQPGQFQPHQQPGQFQPPGQFQLPGQFQPPQQPGQFQPAQQPGKFRPAQQPGKFQPSGQFQPAQQPAHFQPAQKVQLHQLPIQQQVPVNQPAISGNQQPQPAVNLAVRNDRESPMMNHGKQKSNGDNYLKNLLKNKIHLSVVCCGDRLEETTVMLKSATMFTKTSMHFHIFAEDHLHEELFTKLNSWPAAFRRKFSFNMYPITFPAGEDPEVWKKVFKLCATQRLFLPDVLTSVDSVLYVDTDILFIRPLEKIWSFFKEFNSTQFAAMTPEHEIASIGWYNRFGRHPYYGLTGLNSGVMLMNLTRMRTFEWTSKIVQLYREYKLKITWGDQDLINILFHLHPECVYVYPCEWNFRPDACMYSLNCHRINDHGVSIIHGNREVYHNYKQLPFRAIYDAFHEYEFGTDLKTALIQGIRQRFSNPNLAQMYCAKTLLMPLTNTLRESINLVNPPRLQNNNAQHNQGL